MAATPGRARTFAYRTVGTAAVGAALAGTVMPVVPTTPFLLVALWAFTRGSPELRHRLLSSRRFGPMLRDWEQHRAVPRRAKVLACAGMTGSWTWLAYVSDSVFLLTAMAVGMAAVGTYVVIRPEPSAEQLPTLHRPARAEPADRSP